MTAVLATLLGVALAGLLGLMQFQFSQINHRLDRIESRLDELTKQVVAIGQHIDDHITDHPGPGKRVAIERNP